MSRLRDLDDVAYVRFASVYRSFKDINEFMSELKDILDRRDEDQEIDGYPLHEEGAVGGGAI